MWLKADKQIISFLVAIMKITTSFSYSVFLTGLLLCHSGSIAFGQENISIWEWDVSGISREIEEKTVLAYDSEGTLRPLCIRRHLSVAGASLGLRVIDRSFPGTDDFGECQSYITPGISTVAQSILLAGSVSARYKWLSPGQWEALDEFSRTPANQFDDIGLIKTYPATFCQTLNDMTLRDETGNPLPAVGVTSSAGVAETSNGIDLANCYRGENTTIDRPWKYLGLNEGGNMTPLHSTPDSIQTILHSSLAAIKKDYRTINKLPIIRVHNVSVSPFYEDVISPCLAQETGVVFNLGMVINGLRVGDTFFSGGCLYTNTANQRSFISQRYYQLTLPETVETVDVSPAATVTDDVWDTALHAGLRPEESGSTQLFICSVTERVFPNLEFLNSRVTLFGRTVRGSSFCYYSRVQVDVEGEGDDIDLLPKSSAEFKLYIDSGEMNTTEPTSGEGIITTSEMWMIFFVLASVTLGR